MQTPTIRQPRPLYLIKDTFMLLVRKRLQKGYHYAKKSKSPAWSFVAFIYQLNLVFFLPSPVSAYISPSGLWSIGTTGPRIYSSYQEACKVAADSRLGLNGYYNLRYFNVYEDEKNGYARCVYTAKKDGQGLESRVYRNGVNCPTNSSLISGQCICNAEYYESNGACISGIVPIKNLGSGETDQAGGPSTCAGNPINFAMGIKVQEEEDYRSALEHHPLQLTRHFSSADGYWRHNYATRLLVETSRVTLFFPDGRGIPFTRSGVTITADADELGHLVQTSTGWLYTAVDNSRYAFNVDGRLIQQSEPYGLHHNLTYGPGGSITVTDSFGNSFSFTEDAHFQPRSLTAPGISVTYTYDSSDRLLSATKTADATVVGTRTYHYENTTYPRFLTGITDELDVRYATFAYDSQGRAISSSHAAGADLTQVTYNTNGTVTVTNPLGKQSTYHFATIQGIKRIAQIVGEPAPNCPASNSTFTYDTRGLLASQTDHLGHITQHTYNVRGLRTSTTEAVGTAQQRVTTTTWHPTLPLPMQIVEPQRTTTYTRDTQGRVLTRTIAD